MKLTRTESFKRDFGSLPDDIRKQVEKAIRLLVSNPRHPSLQMKKMEPRTRGIFEIRITKNYRLTFGLAPAEVILRRVGTHDILRTP